MQEPESPIQLIEKHYERLSKTERRVADYVRLYPDKTIISSLQAVSEKCSVSDASVLRFCRSLGFSGYQDFKAALVPELLKKGASLYQEVALDDDFNSLKNKFLQNLAKDINKTLDRYAEKAIDTLATKFCQAEHILIAGLAGSAGVARIFNDCLLGLGILSTYISDRVELERVVSRLDRDDLIFGISHSGETQEIVHAIKRGKENKVFTIGMTNFVSSPVAKLADIALLTTVPETLLGSYSCQPRIAQLALLEFITFRISSILKKGGYGCKEKLKKGGDLRRKT
ncbi:MAG TPA: MurR/RpiR family transcriptional regulator [Spirochaetia bacterium]|nr:MurR/RpiR family transcriptional regulator [Spirochaetia bacterium]